MFPKDPTRTGNDDVDPYKIPLKNGYPFRRNYGTKSGITSESHISHRLTSDYLVLSLIPIFWNIVVINVTKQTVVDTSP
jgi:hypothetical protein